MNSRIEALSREPGARCDHTSRREIRLRWPYPEARIVRARLISETGTRFDVSPLYEIDGGWAITICRECAKTPTVSPCDRPPDPRGGVKVTLAVP
jgi:hypothetical protein